MSYSKQRAKSLLVHYFEAASKGSDIGSDSDCITEIEGIVEDIIEAAVEAAKEAVCKECKKALKVGVETVKKPSTVPPGCEHEKCICRQCGHLKEDGSCLDRYTNCEYLINAGNCPVEKCRHFEKAV